MDVIAEGKYIKVSPRKAQLVADAVRKLTPQMAMEQLALMRKSAAEPIAAVLKSALANATHNAKLKVESMRIKEIVVNGAPALKRWQPVSRGRAHAYKKRMSHIRIVLSDEIEQIKNIVKEKKKEVQPKALTA